MCYFKRKLRLAEKRSDNNDKTIDEEQNVDKKPEKVNTSVSEVVQTQTVEPNNDFQFTNSNEAIALDDKLSIGSTKDSESDKNESTQHSINQHKESGTDSQSENIQPDVQSGFIPEKTELTPDELQYVQMKVEHNALLKFVSDLQTNINNERADVVKLRSQVLKCYIIILNVIFFIVIFSSLKLYFEYRLQILRIQILI